MHPVEVAEGGEGDGLGEGVDVVGVLHLVEGFDEVGRADAVAEAQTCEREAFGERAHHDDVRVAGGGRKVHARGVGEVDIGLVHHDDAGEGAREGGDRLLGVADGRGGVGVREEEERHGPPVRAVRDGRAPGEVGVERARHEGDVADRGERLVERIAGVAGADGLVVVDEGARHEGEHFVRPVADEDARGRGAVQRGDARAQVREDGVGVAAQAVEVEGRQDVRDARRGRVGVLVRVQLDDGRAPGLFTRGVGHEGPDGLCDSHFWGTDATEGFAGSGWSRTALV